MKEPRCVSAHHRTNRHPADKFLTMSVFVSDVLILNSERALTVDKQDFQTYHNHLHMHFCHILCFGIKNDIKL